MIRIPTVAVLAVCLAQGAVKVGVFAAEVKRSFTTAHGLPDSQIRCVAVAGTSKGLAVFSGDAWKVDARYAARPVEACAGAGPTLYFTYDGSFYRLQAGVAERAGALPAGEARSIAIGGSTVYLATNHGLFRRGGASFTAVRSAARDICQVAARQDGERNQCSRSASVPNYAVHRLHSAGVAWHARMARGGGNCRPTLSSTVYGVSRLSPAVKCVIYGLQVISVLFTSAVITPFALTAMWTVVCTM